MSTRNRFFCKYCEKNFAHNRSLIRHVKNLHPGHNLPYLRLEKKTIKVVKKGIGALKVKQTFRLVSLRFDSIDEFNKWRISEECSSNARFVKRRNKRHNNHTTESYRCHRSGYYNPSTYIRKRRPKIQGTCKINSVCPVAIVARCYDSGGVDVKYIPNHNHPNDSKHLYLQKEKKQEIAAMIMSGIPFDDIIDHMRRSAGNDASIFLLTKAHLNNICSSFRIDKQIITHQNDDESVAAWVNLTKSSPLSANLVRFIKFSGNKCPEGVLSEEDFLLIVSDDEMLTRAKPFCGPHHEICIDSISGCYGYDIQLTTMMCIDDHGDGLPVAFCFSSRVNVESMTTFFKVIREALGSHLPEVTFMTDDTDVYFDAWCRIMGVPVQRLLSSWHVDEDCRKHINKIRQDDEAKLVVYKMIISLMEITSWDEFKKELEIFMQTTSHDSFTSEFSAYFQKCYASRPQLWAWSYRSSLRVNHSLRLEAMHRVLCHVHFQGKKVQRLDRGILALMKFINTKLDDRFLKMNARKLAKYLEATRFQHKQSLKLDINNCFIDAHDSLKWMVHGSKGEVYHLIEGQNVRHAPSTCPLRCDDCGVCVHSFTCTCLDSNFRRIICKHIHLLIRAGVKNILSSKSSTFSDNECNSIHLTQPEQTSVLQNEDSNPSILTGDGLMEKLGVDDGSSRRHEIEMYVRLCEESVKKFKSLEDQNVRKLFIENMQTTLTLFPEEKVKELNSQNKQPPNKKIVILRKLK